MKTTLIYPLLLTSFIAFSQEKYNPFEGIGKSTEVVTLSNGKYKEIYGGDTLKRIGSVIFDTKNNKVVQFLAEDDTVTMVVKKEGDYATRWLSLDPLAAKYPSMSPYNFVGNSPILFIDPDGKLLVNAHAREKIRAQEYVQLKQVQNKEILDNLIANHQGDLTPQDIEKYNKKAEKISGLGDAQKELNEIQEKYEIVEKHLNDLKKSNPTEYQYFDALDKHITISIRDEAGLGYAGKTYFNAVFISEGKIKVPKVISVYLYDSEYGTFANELGDVQYFMDKVYKNPTKVSYDKWEKSANYKNPEYKEDSSGAGVYSEKYENDRVEDLQKYNENEKNAPNE